MISGMIWITGEIVEGPGKKALGIGKLEVVIEASCAGGR